MRGSSGICPEQNSRPPADHGVDIGSDRRRGIGGGHRLAMVRQVVSFLSRSTVPSLLRGPRRGSLTRAQPPRRRDLALPAASTRTTPSTGTPGATRRWTAPARGPPAAGLDRLLRLPLVPRDGARVLRGPRGRRADERALRVHQGRPRGAPRRRRRLHGGLPGDDRPGRLAAERVPDPEQAAVLRRYLLPARAAPRDAELAHGARGGVRRRGRSGATRCASQGAQVPRRSAPARGMQASAEPITEQLLDRGALPALRRLL